MAETAVALTRTCNKCYVAKPATTEHFYPHKKGKYGLRTECRSCGAKIAAGRKDYRSAKSKEWAANNRERRRETEKKRLSDPVAKEKRRIWLAEWRAANRDRILARERRARTPEKMRERRQRQKARDPEKHKENWRAYYRRKMQSDPKFGIDQRISSRIRKSLRNQTFGRRWEHVLGYTLVELMVHLERQFSQGMCWENRGEWEIDHIVPLASLSYETTDDAAFKAAWALSNLRPLWAEENRRKSSKLLLLV